MLCWLAACNENNEPNVSPKEMFTYKDGNTLIIANIASPNSVNNINHNRNVCVSFVDVFVQKGYKLKGIATIIDQHAADFKVKVKLLIDLFTDQFPIKSLIEIKVTKVGVIQAPSYFLYPDTKEEMQIANAMVTYGVSKAD